MALGDAGKQNNGGNGKQHFDLTYWSRFNIKAADGKMKLAPSFSGGLMKLSVLEHEGDFKYKDVASVSLSPTKAKILACEIDSYIEAKKNDTYIPGRGYGIDTGINDIRPYACVVELNGLPYFSVGKINPDGSFNERKDYPINTNYHYGIDFKSFEEMDVEKRYYDYTELEQIRDLCNEFSIQYMGATAAATCDMMRWDYPSKKIGEIAAKLGVETKGYSNNTGNSFFNKNDNTPAEHNRTSIEDLENELG